MRYSPPHCPANRCAPSYIAVVHGRRGLEVPSRSGRERPPERHNDRMTAPILGTLSLTPIADDLLAPPVAAALLEWPGRVGQPVHQLYTAEIDPALADTAAFCEHYDVPMAASANCVIVSGKRDGQLRWAAAVVLATTRVDVNGVLRQHLNLRKISFAAMVAAVTATGMEYGGITPIGLPGDWPILIDRAVTVAGPVVLGSGRRASKIVVDGAALAALPRASVLDGLGLPRG